MGERGHFSFGLTLIYIVPGRQTHGIFVVDYGTSEQIHPGFVRGRKTKTKFPFPAQRRRLTGIVFGGTSLCRKEGL